MYYLFLDESGDEGDFDNNKPNKGGSSEFFTVGGIIIKDENRNKFRNVYDLILSRFFNNIELPNNFKLHYTELREGREYPYNLISKDQRFEISNTIFNAINTIDCNLLSVTIDLDRHCTKYNNPVSPLAWTLYLIMERFQYFLEDTNEKGEIIFERYNSRLRRKVNQIHLEFNQNPNFPKFTDLINITSPIIDGDPTIETPLTFADFFAYIPYIKCSSHGQKMDRWNEIKFKYYNYNHRDGKRRGNYEI